MPRMRGRREKTLLWALAGAGLIVIAVLVVLLLKHIL
jgi:hypothetical protein